MTNEFTEKNKYYFYHALPQKAPVAECKVTMKETVNPKLLAEACSMALAGNYAFRQKPLIDRSGDIVCCENTADVPVTEDDGKNYALGSTDSNSYLFRVMYSENSIGIRYSHAITDGRGGILFFHTLLYHYFSLQGHPIESDASVILDKDREDMAVRGDVADDLPKDVAVKRPKDTGELFSTPEQRTLMETELSRCFLIHFPAVQLKELAKRFGATPVPILAALVAETMHDIYEVGERTIMAGVPVDMRAFLKPRALANYSSMTFLPFEALLAGLSMEEKAKALSETLADCLERDNLFGMAKLLSGGPVRTDYPPMDDREKVLELYKARITQVGRFTYLLTNVGRIRLPKGMEERITSYEMGTVALSYTPSMSVYTYGDTVCLGLACNFREDGLAKAILERMKTYHLAAEMVFDGYTTMDTVRTDYFEKVG